MKILALETNHERLIEDLCAKSEACVARTGYHGFHFFLHILDDVVQALLLITGAYFMYHYDFPYVGVLMSAILLSLLYFVALDFLRAFIDWKYDFIVLTTDKLLLIDQASLWKRDIREMHMENIASISCETQLLNLFGFARLKIDLKEGTGTSVHYDYVRNAEDFARVASDQLVEFNRRYPQATK